MSRISEEMLIAWCDGELDEVNRRRVDRAIANDPELAARVNEHQQLREMLVGHFAPIVKEDVPDRFATMLREGGAPIAASAKAPATPARWAGWAISSGIAASLLVGLAIGRLWGSGGEDGVGVRGGRMVARGEVAAALDTQLASKQDGKAVRIGVTFQQKGGGWCRSFNSEPMEGVACFVGKRWRLQQVVPGSLKSNSYQQAVSGDARIMETVKALMDGAPADAAQEAQAKADGWH